MLTFLAGGSGWSGKSGGRVRRARRSRPRGTFMNDKTMRWILHKDNLTRLKTLRRTNSPRDGMAARWKNKIDRTEFSSTGENGWSTDERASPKTARRKDLQPT